MNLESRDLRAAAESELASRLSNRYLEEHKLIPLEIDSAGYLRVAAAGTPDQTVLDELARVFGRDLRIVQVPASELLAALMSVKPAAENGDSATASYRDVRADDLAVDHLEALANEAPVVKLVNVLLVDALRLGASDVHLESLSDGLRVRYRIDGVLQDISRIADVYRAAVVSRVKIMAGLDIAERRLPQDGRSRLVIGEREVDVRVSSLPALHGESIVLRMLDHGARPRRLEELGMPDEIRSKFERILARTSGIVVVTGPTGSGKTTTLYAALERVNSTGVKIVTIEEPVEYQIPGVIQIPVNPKVDFGFSDALRSILRHDPDIIMVGEMRDAETAEIAVQAALTGHLVFSTLHTAEAAGAVSRLADMGVEAFRIAAAVQAVIAQRLVRLLCEACAVPYVPSAAELADAPEPDAREANYRRPAGCERCAKSGYRGRTGVYELMAFSEGERSLIAAGATLAQLRSAARENGTVALEAAAWKLVRAGATSIAELRRAVGSANEA
ncbi:MAG: type II/IV secretion system protein [Gemmatimonadaceae bacterium]|nr:type II/IV secretion system protein [Gemmatimonadaceae bacterium]